MVCTIAFKITRINGLVPHKRILLLLSLRPPAKGSPRNRPRPCRSGRQSTAGSSSSPGAAVWPASTFVPRIANRYSGRSPPGCRGKAPGPGRSGKWARAGRHGSGRDKLRRHIRRGVFGRWRPICARKGGKSIEYAIMRDPCTFTAQTLGQESFRA